MVQDGNDSTQRAKVALVACADYERDTVDSAVARCFELLGGLGEHVKKGGRVAVKPNMLIALSPKRAVTTHPAVLRAVLSELDPVAGEVVVGDCPMFQRPETALKRCGLLEVMEELDVDAADMDTVTVIQGVETRRYSRFEVARSIAGADLIVNLFKIKTHGMSGLTLAIKNLFGVIPGLEKSKWHLKAASHAEFNEMLVDLFEALQVHVDERGGSMLHVCDGVIGIEGEGPGPAGRPREIGVIAASTDAVALETVLARVVGFEVDDVLTIPIAKRRGVGVADLDRIDIVGDSLDDLSLSPGSFEPNRGSVRSGVTFTQWPFNSKFVRDRMVERPVIDQERCTGCGECRKVCAAKAITLSGKPKTASVDPSICIRCYCCVEVCQYEAARLGPRPPLARVVDQRHLLPWVGAGLAVVAIGATVAYFWLD